MSHYQAVINSPLGKLGLSTSEKALNYIDFLADSAALIEAQSEIAEIAVNELQQYFDNPHYQFELPLQLLNVSHYQNTVLTALQKIPVGQTRTYGQLAKLLDSGPRAIGMACRHNPIPIIIPCHRIVAATHLGGYGGATEGKNRDIKQWLLRHETLA